MTLAPDQVLLRLIAAALLGCLVGLERERLDRAAGLRTHALVAVGSALCMIVSSHGFADVLGLPNASLDPSRVAAQVVSGIGFLGAGTIILRREVVQGLTTAASVWGVAAIGLACGGGLYLAAAGATLLILLILVGLKPVERRLFEGQRWRSIQLECARDAHLVTHLQTAIAGSGLVLETVVVRPGTATTGDRIEVVVRRADDARLLRAVESLGKMEGVSQVTFDRHGGRVESGSLDG